MGFILRTAAITVLAGLWSALPLPSVGSEATAATESTGIRLLEEFQSVITDLAERGKPSVVNVLPSQGPGRRSKKKNTQKN